MRELMIESAIKIMRDLSTKEIVDQAEEGNWSRKLWKTMVDSGMLSVGVSEEHGGIGGSYGDALSILRIAGKYSAPIPLAETLVVNWLLADRGVLPSEKPLSIIPVDQKNEVVFTNTQDGWLISGNVSAVPWARFSNAILVIGKSTNGNKMALIEEGSLHVEAGQNLAGEPRDNIRFKDIHVKENQCFSIDQKMIDKIYYIGALTKTVLMSGALERVLELTITYSKEREQFGRPISRFQAIQHHIANISAEVTAATMSVSHAIESFSGEPNDEIIFAKICTSKAATIVTPIAHQVHGAIGFTDEHVLHQSTRRLWSWRDEYGTESDWAEKLGDIVIQNGSDELWSVITS